MAGNTQADESEPAFGPEALGPPPECMLVIQLLSTVSIRQQICLVGPVWKHVTHLGGIWNNFIDWVRKGLTWSQNNTVLHKTPV